MNQPFACRRCGRTDDPLPSPPLFGETGEELATTVCKNCWHDWQEMEIRVINELRLNFMDPEASTKLEEQMFRFLDGDREPK